MQLSVVVKFPVILPFVTVTSLRSNVVGSIAAPKYTLTGIKPELVGEVSVEDMIGAGVGAGRSYQRMASCKSPDTNIRVSPVENAMPVGDLSWYSDMGMAPA